MNDFIQYLLFTLYILNKMGIIDVLTYDRLKHNQYLKMMNFNIKNHYF